MKTMALPVGELMGCEDGGRGKIKIISNLQPTYLKNS